MKKNYWAPIAKRPPICVVQHANHHAGLCASIAKSATAAFLKKEEKKDYQTLGISNFSYKA